MIAIIDYGLGNVLAFANIYRRLGIPNKVVRRAVDLESADCIILPGVGAFDWAMTQLNASGLRECLEFMVLEKRCPILGVCVGMQMLGKQSEEGDLPGLGWLNGVVEKLRPAVAGSDILLPHMGWNTVLDSENNGLFHGVVQSEFYFLHSYCFLPKGGDEALAMTNYQTSFVSAVKYKNIFGVQFHPEKSHNSGIKILKNFYELVKC